MPGNGTDCALAIHASCVEVDEQLGFLVCCRVNFGVIDGCVFVGGIIFV